MIPSAFRSVLGNSRKGGVLLFLERLFVIIIITTTLIILKILLKQLPTSKNIYNYNINTQVIIDV